MLTESDEIRFDIVWSGAGRRLRRVMVTLSAFAMMSWSRSTSRSRWHPFRAPPGFSSRHFATATPAAAQCAERRRRPLTDLLTLSVLSIVVLAIPGLPIGHAMIASSIHYLMLAGLDMGTAAEQLLNGLFSSYILLAVPLFVLATEPMNSGSMTIRLLASCNAFVCGFRGELARVNVVQSIIFAGMLASVIADAAGTGRPMLRMMTEGGRYPLQFAAALTASSAVIGPIIPLSIPVPVRHNCRVSRSARCPR